LRFLLSFTLKNFLFLFCYRYIKKKLAPITIMLLIYTKYSLVGILSGALAPPSFVAAAVAAAACAASSYTATAS
jgi:hypothetical protein